MKPFYMHSETLVQRGWFSALIQSVIIFGIEQTFNILAKSPRHIKKKWVVNHTLCSSNLKVEVKQTRLNGCNFDCWPRTGLLEKKMLADRHKFGKIGYSLKNV